MMETFYTFLWMVLTFMYLSMKILYGIFVLALLTGCATSETQPEASCEKYQKVLKYIWSYRIIGHCEYLKTNTDHLKARKST